MVTKVSVPAEIAARIASRIAAFPVEAPETIRWLAPYVAEFAALPMFLGWIETIGIRPDGELVRWSTEGDYPGTLPVDDRSGVLTALVSGADRYPELRPLLPVRGPDAIDCPCRAIPLIVSGKVGCAECGGIGWLPAPGAPPSRGPATPSPRVRFTVRRLMVAVALAALVAGLIARSRQMSEVAARHEAGVIEHSQMMPLPNGGLVELLDNWGQWHRAMAEKYRRAARYPFLPVWPDPPGPDGRGREVEPEIGPNVRP